VVAAIHMRRVGRLVLAAQPHRDQRGKAAEHETVGVDQQPVLFDVGQFGGKSLHLSRPEMPAASATESFRRTGLKRALRLPDGAAPVKQNAFQYKVFYIGYDNTSTLNRSSPSRQAPSRAALRPVPGTIGLT